MDFKELGTHMQQARREVDRICKENGWSLDNIADMGKIFGAIDARFDKRRYKCPVCKDSGIVSWIDPDDGLNYGRKCGYCRYWDDQREKWKREREARGIKD